MKILIQIIFYLSFAQVVAAQVDSAGCKFIRKGKFAYTNDSSEAIIITRNGNRQEEHNRTKNIITKFKIRWINPCSYELKQVWSNSKKQRKQNRSVTTVIITSVNEEGYGYTCACKDDIGRKKFTGIAYRVN